MLLIPVMSGKGGVGKTTVCIGLATALKAKGVAVGILDLDLENPSLGTACGMDRDNLQFKGEYIIPPLWNDIPIMSLSLLPLSDFKDTPTLADEERKHEIIYQLASEVDWGDSEILLMDMPPGSGEEVRGILQFSINGTVLVTAPQQLSETAVRRVIMMSHEYEIPIIGILENNINQASGEAGVRLSEEYNLKYLGKVGWTKTIGEAMEAHEAFNHKTFDRLAQIIEDRLSEHKGETGDDSAGHGIEAVVRDGIGDGQQAGIASGDQEEVSGVSAEDGGNGDSPPPA